LFFGSFQRINGTDKFVVQIVAITRIGNIKQAEQQCGFFDSLFFRLKSRIGNAELFVRSIKIGKKSALCLPPSFSY
jgi:hypothetical protein